MIPRIIHQTWKSRTEIPADLRGWRESFARWNPGFELRLYDDADNRAIVAGSCPGLLPVYDALPAEIFRADFVRPLYLYLHGGIYADMDMQCLRPLDGYAERDGVFLGAMGDDPAWEHAIPNAMMAGTARHPFWLLFLAAIVRRARALGPASSRRERKVEYVTGPAVLHEACGLHGAPAAADLVAAFRGEFAGLPEPDPAPGPVVVHPPHVWFPFDWRDDRNAAIRRRLLKGRGWASLLPAWLHAAVGTPMRAPTVEESRALFPNSEAVTFWRHSW
jgi:hypothetical protein